MGDGPCERDQCPVRKGEFERMGAGEQALPEGCRGAGWTGGGATPKMVEEGPEEVRGSESGTVGWRCHVLYSLIHPESLLLVCPKSLIHPEISYFRSKFRDV